MMRIAAGKTARTAVALVLAALMLLCSGCQFHFDTVILSDTDSPDTVLEYFFDALKSRDYSRCGAYLADNETFVVTDNTGYGFVNALTDQAMNRLDYSKIGACEINNLSADRKISVTAIDMDGLSECIKQHFVELEYDYLTDNNKRSIDIENDKEDIGNIIKIAIEKYADTVGTVNREVTVHFVFEDGGWKIKLEADLTAAILGDDSHE